MCKDTDLNWAVDQHMGMYTGNDNNKVLDESVEQDMTCTGTLAM